MRVRESRTSRRPGNMLPGVEDICLRAWHEAWWVVPC